MAVMLAAVPATADQLQLEVNKRNADTHSKEVDDNGSPTSFTACVLLQLIAMFFALAVPRNL